MNSWVEESISHSIPAIWHIIHTCRIWNNRSHLFEHREGCFSRSHKCVNIFFTLARLTDPMWMWRHMMGCHVGGGTWTWGDPDVRDRWPLVTEPWGQGGQIARPRSRKHLNITGRSRRKASIGNQEKVLIWKHESSVVDNISYKDMNFEIRSFISR